MNILCLSPFFPPSGDSESFCGGKMVLALRDQGVDVTVFHMDSSYLFPPDLSRRWEALHPNSLRINSRLSEGRLHSCAWALRFRTPAYARWIEPAMTRAAQLHREKAFDLVYSRSLPFFAHVAGYWISRKLRLPWIANVNDPWDLHLFPDNRARPAPRLYALSSNYWLRKTLTYADAVTFPCRRLALFTARTPSCRARMEIIPHIGAESASATSAQVFTLVHAGKLGQGEISGRSPASLLRGLKRFLTSQPAAAAKARLVLVGPSDPGTEAAIDDLDLRKNVAQTGRLSYDDSLVQIAGASACVLIEGDMQEGLYLPSKLVDYLAARKPVLALSPRVGTVRDMSTDRAIMPVDQSDECGIAYAITVLFRAYLDGELNNWRPSDTLVNTFSAEVVASRFLSFASQLSPCLEHSLNRRETIMA